VVSYIIVGSSAPVMKPISTDIVRAVVVQWWMALRSVQRSWVRYSVGHCGVTTLEDLITPHLD